MNRRQFVLGTTPLVAATAIAAETPNAASRYASRLRMVADGPTTLNYVVFNPANPPAFPRFEDWMQIRVRSTFPYQDRDLLHTLIYIANVNDDKHQPVFPISEFIIAVEDIDISDSPVNTIGFFGKCVANPVVSPFGVIVGRVFSMACQFTQGDPTTFELWGGYAAGTHATFVPKAIGELLIQRPWQSF